MIFTGVVSVEPVFAIDAVPEELFVEAVRLLEEGLVTRVLVDLPGALDVSDGRWSVHSRDPGHSEVIRDLVLNPVRCRYQMNKPILVLASL